MNPPQRFLNALSQVFSAMSLYGEGHPARERALDEVCKWLAALLKENRHSTFTFLEGEVVFSGNPLREFRNWPLGKRMDQIKVQRLEFMQGVTRKEVHGFLNDIALRLSAGPAAAGDSRPVAYPHILYGLVRKEQERPEGSINLTAEAGNVDSIHDEAESEGTVPIELARSVVDTLTDAMRSESRLLVPLVPLRETDEYSTVHSMNTSVLSMALGEYLHLAGPEVRIIGEAALLHDVGKVSVPKEILNKPDKLEEEEWEVIKQHPLEGARMILKSGEGLDVAAMTAYEHHLKWNGGGYPELRFPRRPHRVSQLVHLCDAYDAMRTQRPFQDPIDHDEILRILERGAGVEWDPDLVRDFAVRFFGGARSIMHVNLRL